MLTTLPGYLETEWIQECLRACLFAHGPRSNYAGEQLEHVRAHCVWHQGWRGAAEGARVVLLAAGWRHVHVYLGGALVASVLFSTMVMDLVFFRRILKCGHSSNVDVPEHHPDYNRVFEYKANVYATGTSRGTHRLKRYRSLKYRSIFYYAIFLGFFPRGFEFRQELNVLPGGGGPIAAHPTRPRPHHGDLDGIYHPVGSERYSAVSQPSYSRSLAVSERF